MKVTIGVPVYGVERYIERCARSLFEQTYKNIEYIFLNDCTKDRSILLLEKTIKKYPNRKKQIKIINHETNKGLGSTRNSIIENSTGEFILHVDSDDYVSPYLVEELVQIQIKECADIVCCNYFEDWGNNKYVTINETRYQDKREWLSEILKGNANHSIWGKLIRLSLYKDYHICVADGIGNGEDLQIVPQIFYYSKRIVLCEQPLYYYNRRNENSYGATFNESKTHQILLVENKLAVFFSDKEQCYKMATDIGLTYIIAQYRLGCARIYNKEFFNELQRIKKRIGFKHIFSIPTLYAISYLIDNLLILHYFAKIGHIIKIKSK